MSEQENAEIVRRLWDRIEARDWDGAGDLLAEDFTAAWPHSGERFRGRDDYIGMNRDYPEGWRIEVLRIVAQGDRVISEVRVPHPALGTSYVAASFEVRDGLIRSSTEYWVDWKSQEPPEGRGRWAEVMSEPP